MYTVASDLLLMILTGVAIIIAVHQVVSIRRNYLDKRLDKEVDYFVEACSREARKIGRSRKG